MKKIKNKSIKRRREEPALVELAGGGEGGAGDLLGVEAVGADKGAVLPPRQGPRHRLRREMVPETSLVRRRLRRRPSPAAAVHRRRVLLLHLSYLPAESGTHRRFTDGFVAAAIYIYVYIYLWIRREIRRGKT